MSVLPLLQLRAFQLSLPRKGRCRPRAVVICQIFYFLFHLLLDRPLAYLMTFLCPVIFHKKKILNNSLPSKIYLFKSRLLLGHLE